MKQILQRSALFLSVLALVAGIALVAAAPAQAVGGPQTFYNDGNVRLAFERYAGSSNAYVIPGTEEYFYTGNIQKRVYVPPYSDLLITDGRGRIEVLKNGSTWYSLPSWCAYLSNFCRFEAGANGVFGHPDR